eukprot:CAMPEP_0198727660 /NCGR_PEP_ID=MMETSP1475-20131203/4724_1 /TAXON_ID= ORGANISM="Unidentified sp., Strain CCMP1999" /NCGR_SAMPLE_ID=MMETSP1475 /ASSEMBLY_ACC=CAM_ASM_001111 /LENGTH=64 /DNA_ID=CAMNT_0044489747 /DNA_START=26 /DNA_END=217 /DNA_ORIENTATION=+
MPNEVGWYGRYQVYTLVTGSILTPVNPGAINMALRVVNSLSYARDTHFAVYVDAAHANNEDYTS